jgi:serine O-acetyltransferase
MFERIREDIKAVFDKDPAARSVWEVLCCYPGLHAVWLHRVAHWLWVHDLRFLGRLVSHVNRWLTGIEIHPGAKLGRRVFIDHGMGVVIGETAEVSDDVLMYQGVVLGGTALQKVKRHPTIGKNVVIGSGSIVLGPITVGDNAKVGAGSVVVRPVPEGATVVGVPARLVGQPEPGRAAIDLQHGALPDPVVRAISESLDRQSRLEERMRDVERRLVTLSPPVVPAPVPPAPLGPQPQRLSADAELEQRVREALDEVLDPEVGVSLVQLGFVRGVVVNGEQVEVRLALDDPRCPMIEHFVEQIRRKVKGLNGIHQVEVTLVDNGAVPLEREGVPGGADAPLQELLTERVHNG